MKKSNNKKLKFLDLFAGAGGLSEGFIRAGFSPVAHVEADQAACFTLRTRMAYHWLKARDRSEQYNDYLRGNISRSELYSLVPDRPVNSVINTEISKDSLSEIFRKTDELLDDARLDLIIGGPPCHAYSIIGSSSDKKRMKGDRRNYLYVYYTEFLKRYRPSWFVFENVSGLLSAKDEDGNLYFDNMRSLFHDAGYETEFMTLAAEEYGVLQSRKRIILLGKRGKSSGFYPELAKWHPGVKVSEVFRDLPPLRAGTHRHRDSFLDRFKVVAAELQYSHTVVAHIAKDGHYYIHPDIEQNRSLTPREAARLQTFPDDYFFESASGVPQRTPTFRQIGNAVPVLLARNIAEKLKEVW
jgi:DNA (cytosine-5)-methyltransferase 1